MGHRNLIGIREPDGQITSIYCHWGAYKNIDILADCYSTETDVRALLRLGDLSELDDTIEGCSAYARDWNRSYTRNAARRSRDMKAWLRRADQQDCEGVFLFENGEWTGGSLSEFAKKIPEPVF